MHDDERAIRDLIENWFKHTERGEIDRVLELMTDDVVFMVVGRPPFGKQEFAEGARQMRTMKFQGSAEVLEVVVRDDTAWARVHIQVEMQTPDGRSPRREGYAMSVLTRQNGRWLVTRDANLLGPAG